jgi:hypothetical protein
VDLARIKNYSEHIDGLVTATRIPKSVDIFMRQVVRNTILSFLSNAKTRPWFNGVNPKQVSLDDMAELGYELDNNHEMSWVGLPEATASHA